MAEDQDSEDQDSEDQDTHQLNHDRQTSLVPVWPLVLHMDVLGYRVRDRRLLREASKVRIIVTGLLVCFALGGSACAQDWSFTLDGEKIAPRLYSLQGTPEVPHAGDVVYVGGYLLVLDGPGPFEFFTDKKSPEGKGLYRGSKGGARDLVAIQVDWEVSGSDRRFVDGSKGLSASELLTIRGIKIGWDGKSAWFAKLLRQLDLSKVCIELSNSDCVKTGDHYTTYINRTKTPAFPKGLRYLWFAEGFGSYESLAKTPELRFYYGGLADTKWELLAGKPRLRYLDLSYCDLDESEPSGEETEARPIIADLRALILRRAHTGMDPEPDEDLSGLPRWLMNSLGRLRVLDLSQSEGLARLVALHYPNLTHLDISGTSGYHLPARQIPNLKKLNVMSAGFTATEIADIQRLHPKCLIVSDWAKVLRAAIPAPTRMRVRRSGSFSLDRTERKALLDLRDPKEVLEFLSLIEIDGRRSGGHCMCGGDPTLEFFQGKRLVAALGMHHARSLRWADGQWIGDAQLTANSRKRALAWLDRHGVSGPRKDLERQKRQALQVRKAEEKWRKGMPPSLLPFWKKRPTADVDAMHEVLAKAMPDLPNRIRALLHWYGCGTGVWSAHPSYESVAMELLYKYKTADVLAALADIHLTVEFKEGAAHFFGCHPFTQRRPDDLALLPKALKKTLLQHCLDTGETFKKDWAKGNFGSK